VAVGRGDVNGYWFWNSGPDGVCLVVCPPRGHGRRVPEDDVRGRLKAAEVKGVDWPAVAAAVRQTTGQPVIVAPPQDAVAPQDGWATVEVAADRMAAFMRVMPPVYGRPLDEAGAHGALRAGGVVFGIDADAVRAALARADPQSEYLVARGRPAVPGTDGAVRFAFQTERDTRPAERSDGGVDFRDLGLVQNVTAGQTLAALVDPGPGTPGSTVTGEAVPARPGREACLVAGDNVNAVDRGRRLAAATDGHVQLGVGARISVLRVFEVKGSVDLTTGNISFLGSLVVRGDVTDGMTVEARGDVTVEGHVGAASVKAVGDIIVKRGVKGQSRGQVRAGRDVRALFIENADVGAGRDVLVGDALIHSRVTAGGAVTVAGRGLLVGGVVHAREAVVARTIGSPLATPTEVEVGVDPGVRAEHRDVADEIAARSRDLEEAHKTAALFQRARGEGRALLVGAERALQAVRVRARLRKDLDRLKARLAELEGLMAGRSGRVRASGAVCPGVRVVIGRAALVVNDRIVAATLSLGDDGEVCIGPY